MRPDAIDYEAMKMIEEMEVAGQSIPTIDFPFTVGEEGILFVKEGSAPARLAARIDVLAETRDHLGDNWGRLLGWKDGEGHEHQWVMPLEMLASDSGTVRARLLNGGLQFLTSNARLRERLSEYLQTAPVSRRVRCVKRIGWHGNQFVFPDETIGAAVFEELLYQPSQEESHHWNRRGSAAEWRQQVGRLCSGNSRLIIAVSCAFAAPLLARIGGESGGVHFRGDTSTGKSTALIVGGSVCGGGGQSGFVQTWRATTNGLEAIAEVHNDGALFLDELSQVEPSVAAETAYLLGNGQGKARMTRTIGVRRRPCWTLLFISAGEMTLAEHAASAGKRTKGGADVRLLTVEADGGKGLGLFESLHGTDSADAFAQQLKDAALSHYGAVLRAFIGRIAQDFVAVELRVKSAQVSFITRCVPTGAGGELKRAAGRFALIGVAGELATEWGLTGWKPAEAMDAAQRCFEEWAKARGTAGASDSETGIRQVRAYLENHGGSRFQLLLPSAPDDAQAERILNRAGFKRLNSEGRAEYLILQETFKKDICAGHNHRAVLQELDRRGFLVREHPNMTVKVRLPEMGIPRVYCIRASLMEAEEC